MHLLQFTALVQSDISSPVVQISQWRLLPIIQTCNVLAATGQETTQQLHPLLLENQQDAKVWACLQVKITEITPLELELCTHSKVKPNRVAHIKQQCSAKIIKWHNTPARRWQLSTQLTPVKKKNQLFKIYDCYFLSLSSLNDKSHILALLKCNLGEYSTWQNHWFPALFSDSLTITRLAESVLKYLLISTLGCGQVSVSSPERLWPWLISSAALCISWALAQHEAFELSHSFKPLQLSLIQRHRKKVKVNIMYR